MKEHYEANREFLTALKEEMVPKRKYVKKKKEEKKQDITTETQKYVVDLLKQGYKPRQIHEVFKVSKWSIYYLKR